jgi:hypothetical protein
MTAPTTDLVFAECGWCGASLAGCRGTRYCSNSCSTRARHATSRNPAKLLRTCALCAVEFSVQYPSDRRTFCGYSCSARARPPRTGQSDSNWRGGNATHPLYQVYIKIIDRCHNPNSKDYKRYGARGIHVCDRWRADLWKFVQDMGPRPTGLIEGTARALFSVDRIDNDGP